MTEPATEPVIPAAIDAGSISPAPWAERVPGPFTSGQRTDRFQVVVQQQVLDDIHAHGKENTRIEICGVLVGHVYRDDIGPYLLIHAAIAGDETQSHASNVTFTAKTWASIHEKMDRLYPDDRIVGWYHTHPGFGIFLSEMDVFIQANFFNLPWQVAFVYDPLGGDEGMFIWRQATPTREPILVEASPHAPAGPANVVAGRAARTGKAFPVILGIFIAILAVILIIWEIKLLREGRGRVGLNDATRPGMLAVNHNRPNFGPMERRWPASGLAPRATGFPG